MFTPTADNYKITPNDLLEIEVFGVSELKRTVRVNTSGQVAMPLIGTLSVAGLTPADAEALIAMHYARSYLQDPQVSIFVKEFTDRLFASREREPSGNHEFDQLCQELGIEHRLTKPRTPRTNGMVERFNGRIADVLKTHRFNSREDMEQTLLRYVALCNHQLPQSALKSRTPMQAMKQWYQTHPHLFHKRPYDRPGCDT